jgi:hypothetical protein
MDTISQALADPTTRYWYQVFCFALMILPMIALTWWYHSRIGETAGGRELMGEQERVGVSLNRDPADALGSAQGAVRMAKDIAEGRYGAEVRRMQNLTYLFVGIWLLATFVAFGIMIWADEVNRPPV